MNLSNLVGQVLKEMISARGLTYTVYAEKAGVTQGYISQVVNGDIKGVKLETLEKLVKPLEITVSDFLREVEKKKGVYSQGKRGKWGKGKKKRRIAKSDSPQKNMRHGGCARLKLPSLSARLGKRVLR